MVGMWFGRGVCAVNFDYTVAHNLEEDIRQY